MDKSELEAKIYSKVDELPTLPAVLPKLLSLMEGEKTSGTNIADARVGWSTRGQMIRDRNITAAPNTTAVVTTSRKEYDMGTDRPMTWDELVEVIKQLRAKNKSLREDVKRCGENWKAIYHELKIKLQRITEAWNTEIESKEDSVFVGELHYELPKQTPKGDKDEGQDH